MNRAVSFPNAISDALKVAVPKEKADVQIYFEGGGKSSNLSWGRGVVVAEGVRFCSGSF